MSTYSIIPTEDELKSIERDLRFHQVVNDSPKHLTQDQIEHYNKRGFVAPLTIYSNEEIVSIRNYFDDLLRRVTEAGGDSYSISSAHLKYGPVYDILTNPRIVAHVSDLLGENVIAWDLTFFAKCQGMARP